VEQVSNCPGRRLDARLALDITVLWRGQRPAIEARGLDGLDRAAKLERPAEGEGVGAGDVDDLEVTLGGRRQGEGARRGGFGGLDGGPRPSR